MSGQYLREEHEVPHIKVEKHGHQVPKERQVKEADREDKHLQEVELQERARAVEDALTNQDNTPPEGCRKTPR